MELNRARALAFGAFVVLLALTVAGLLALQVLPGRQVRAEGEVAFGDIKSPQRVTFTSDVQTRLKREQAAEAVVPALAFDPNVSRRQSDQLNGISGAITAILEDRSIGRAERVNRLRALRTPLSDPAVEALADMTATEWRTILDQARQSLTLALTERIPQDRLPQVRSQARERFDPRLTANQNLIVGDLVAGLIVPTVSLDQAETERLRRAALDGVEPVRVTIERGETIVRDGEVITALSLEKLRAAGVLSEQFSWGELLGMVLLGLGGAVLLGAYIWIFDPIILDHPRRLVLLAGIIILTIAASKLTIPGRDVWAIVFPFAAAPMLIATLLDVRLGILVTGILAIWVSMTTRGSLTLPELQLAMVFFLAGTTGVLAVWRAERLYRYFLAGAGVSLATALGVLAFFFIDGGYALERLGFYMLASMINGLLAAVLTIGVFVLLGTLFGIATTWHLMELAQPNQPLLRRLLTEAPGTYHHSIIVANLAERAAESIGADSLLVRVGAYYHDIGKMLRPGYFVENQIDGESPHTHLDPETSARVIKTHVTDGLALARQHRLPAKVQAFIPEHHGTRMAMYFYAMATKVDPDVPPEWFKYPGPIPQSRETAIVMLADSTEATVRANRDHSQESIERIIDQIIAERLQEGQLDDSGLTLGDLKRIRVAFMSVLRGVYHPRIEYPDPVKESSVAGRLSRLRRRPMALPATGNGAAGEPVGGTGPEVGPRPQPTSSS